MGCRERREGFNVVVLVVDVANQVSAVQPSLLE